MSLECVKSAVKEVPDLILLDIKMPQGGGIGAFERLIKLKITKEIPIIFMTAFPTEDIKTQVCKIGAEDCISKPFISKDFEKTIETVIGGKNDQF